MALHTSRVQHSQTKIICFLSLLMASSYLSVLSQKTMLDATVYLALGIFIVHVTIFRL